VLTVLLTVLTTLCVCLAHVSWCFSGRLSKQGVAYSGGRAGMLKGGADNFYALGGGELNGGGGGRGKCVLKKGLKATVVAKAKPVPSSSSFFSFSSSAQSASSPSATENSPKANTGMSLFYLCLGVAAYSLVGNMKGGGQRGAAAAGAGGWAAHQAMAMQQQQQYMNQQVYAGQYQQGLQLQQMVAQQNSMQ
jgi:hypothetical protein